MELQLESLQPAPRSRVGETWGLAEENARAIECLHLEAQTTKHATTNCLRKIHAATKLSIAETFKAAKQLFEMARHAECKIDDCTEAMLEVHDKLHQQCDDAK